MHEDPTRITGPNGVVPRRPGDEITHVSDASDGLQVRASDVDEDGSGATTAGATPVADWYTVADEVAPLRKSPWVMTAALVATAAVGFGVVTGVLSMTRSHSSSDSAVPSATSAAPLAEPIDATPATSSTPTPASSASFPAHSDGHCIPVLPDRSAAPSSQVDDLDVRQDAATNASCPFLVETKKKVWQHESERPNESNYSLSVYSDFREGQIKRNPGKTVYSNPYVSLTCTPRGAITTCTGGDPGILVYVRRQVQVSTMPSMASTELLERTSSPQTR